MTNWQDASTLVLRVVCAYCQKVLMRGTDGAATSHGICEDCVEIHFPRTRFQAAQDNDDLSHFKPFTEFLRRK